MLRLNIETQPAKLGLMLRMPQVELDRVGKGMQIDSKPPAIDISIDFPMIEIDDAAPKAEIGLKPTLMIARELAAAGRQAAHDGIARWAREGDELARIESGTDFAAVAAERAWPGDNRQINVDVAPKSRIKVRVHGRLEIEARPGRMELDMEPEKVSVALRPGVVKSYLAQKAAIEIHVVGDRYSVVG